MNVNPRYNVRLLGKDIVLQVEISDAPTKKGLNLQFVFPEPIEDLRDRQDISNKLSIILQKKFGSSDIAVDYNERNPYKNVISFIVPIKSISDMLTKLLKTKAV